MICEKGLVVSVEDNFAWVETRQNSACSACSAKSGCGQGLLNRVFNGRRHFIKVSTDGFTETLSVHDEVELAIPEHVMLKGALWVYLVPLVAMILGAILAASGQPSDSDVAGILGALAGFLAGLALVRLYAYRHRNDPSFHPVLHRIVSHSSGVEAVSIYPG